MRTEVHELVVVCSDRGQHPVIVLGALRRDELERVQANEAFSGRVFMSRVTDESVWLEDRPEGFRAHIRCPRCRRNIVWTEATTRRVMDALVEEASEQMGRRRIDLRLDASQIP